MVTEFITTYSTDQDISSKEVHEGLLVLLFTVEDKGYKAKIKKGDDLCFINRIGWCKTNKKQKLTVAASYKLSDIKYSCWNYRT